MVPWPRELAPTNGISIRSAVSAYTAAKSLNALQWDGQPPKIAPFPWGLETHVLRGSLGPPDPAADGISIGSAIFARLTNGTNRQTDHRPRYSAPSLAIGRYS